MAPNPRGDVLVVRLVELESLGGETGRDDVLLTLVQHRGQALIGLHRRVQLVAQAEAQREVLRGLPDVVDEEPVAPSADVSLNLVRRWNHRDRKPDHEIGDGVAGHGAGEIEASTRIVGRSPPRRHAPHIEPGADVMRSARIRQHVRRLKRRVELIPVRAAAAQPAERADVDAREARIVVPDVAIEAGNAELRSGGGQVVHGEVIQRVEADAVVADPEIVEQIRFQRVRVGNQRVVVDARLRYLLRLERGAADIARESCRASCSGPTGGPCSRGSDRRASGADPRCRYSARWSAGWTRGPAGWARGRTPEPAGRSGRTATPG